MTLGTMMTLGFIQNVGIWQWLILLMIGLLLFGRRLPEVGRSLGRSIVEFKKGLKGIEDEIDEASQRPSQPPAVSSAPPPRAIREEHPAGGTPALDTGAGQQPADYRVSRADKVE